MVGLWLYALHRRPREWADEQARRAGRRWLLFGGLLLPFGSIAVLLAFGIPAGHRLLPLLETEQIDVDALRLLGLFGSATAAWPGSTSPISTT